MIQFEIDTLTTAKLYLAADACNRDSRELLEYSISKTLKETPDLKQVLATAKVYEARLTREQAPSVYQIVGREYEQILAIAPSRRELEKLATLIATYSVEALAQSIDALSVAL
jgi:hypothetical protein